MKQKTKIKDKKEKSVSMNKKNKVVELSKFARPKPKAHPFANFIENKQMENKFSNQSQKPSMQNIPYRKKAV